MLSRLLLTPEIVITTSGYHGSLWLLPEIMAVFEVTEYKQTEVYKTDLEFGRRGQKSPMVQF